MFQLLSAGFVLGVGAAIGQKVAEKHIIPASKKFYTDLCDGWDEFITELNKAKREE